MPSETNLESGRFNAFHEAMTASLAAALPGVSVDEHSGPFNLDELKAFGAKVPAVRVSIVGPSATLARRAGDREAMLVCAAYVVTKSMPRLPAHKSAMALCERIAAFVHRKTFGLPFVEPPSDVEIANHYGGELREVGGNLALMSVSWSQVVAFGVETAPLPVVTDDPQPAVEFEVESP